MADAEEVELRDVDGRLELVDVRPAEGWSDRVDDESAEEVEIKFASAEGRQYEFEAEIDDGRLETDVCVD